MKIPVSLILRPPAFARIIEEAKRRKVHTDDVLFYLFAQTEFMEEFHKIPTPKDLDLDNDEEFCVTKVREHRGSLTESMETVREVEDFEGLVDVIKKSVPFGKALKPEHVHVEHYTWDGRIGWDTYLISIDEYGVWGMSDGPLK